MPSGIYAIKCNATKQYYIGTAIDWEKRIASHINKLKQNKHKNYKLQAAWLEHGPAAFEFKLLELCPISTLLDRERYWADQTKSDTQGFNLHTLGSNGFLTHGHTYSRTFKSWESMKQRCTNPKSRDYKKYGAVGITVCDRWLGSFSDFLTDMGERLEGTSLDRYPNKYGNYEPGNCRWATPKEQQRNLTNNQYITYNGVTKLLVDWAAETGIPIDLLRLRFNRGDTGPVLFAPSYNRFKGIALPDGSMPKRRRIETREINQYTAHGLTMSLAEWAKHLGVTKGALLMRIHRYKLPLEEALQSGERKKGKTGPRKGHNMITAFGKTQSLTAWSRETGIPVSTIKNRLQRAKLLPELALVP